MPIWLSALGTVQALNVVNVRSRVDGELQAMPLTEGAEVRAGDVLARIDARPLEALLRQAEATLQRDESQHAHALAELERYRGLVAQGFVANTTLQALQATADGLKASVQGDRAQLDAARLQLSFTTIRSPITGRVGFRQMDPGAQVRAADNTGLITVTQIRPIAVLLTVPQDELPGLLQQRRTGPVVALAQSRDGAGMLLGRGELTAADNQIDPATGQIRMKAVFANADGALWPGQLVSVRLLLRTEAAALVLPSQAVLTGQEGAYVYRLGPERSVQVRSVRRGPVVDDWVVIRSGLVAGDQVVLEGQSRLAPGSKVSPRPGAGASGSRP